MRIPVPNDKLVAFTLAGALLTVVVAGALAFPSSGLPQPDSATGPGTAPSENDQVAADAPTPNQDFTPAVQTQSGSGGHEWEDDHDDEHEAYDDEAYDDEAYDDEAYDDEDHDDEDHDDEEHEED